MDRYLPTGNEMISLPKINELTAGIEDFTYLSMQHKGLIEVRGSGEQPLILPFVSKDGEELPLTDMVWNREHYWIPNMTAKAGGHSLRMTILTPVGERGFAMKLSLTASEDLDVTLGLKGCWGSSWHCINMDKQLEGNTYCFHSGWNKSIIFEFRCGAAFCNLFLADEINRTSSKTQSALLELMEEKSITVDGTTYRLPEPYTVIATQNPIGSAGTHSLPDSQLDRFMIKLSMGYPDFSGEVNILKSKYNSNPLDTVNAVANASFITSLQNYISDIYVDDRIYEYVVSLAAATRKHPMIKLGVSPRGTLALMQIAKGIAVAMGRDYVIPDDISYICADVFCHRIMLNSKAKLSDITAEAVIADILRTVPVPGIS